MTELEDGVVNGSGEVFKVPRRGFTAWNRAKKSLPDIDTSKGKLYQCARCGHKWKTKKDQTPSQCPKCQAHRYQNPLPPEHCSLFQGLLAEHIAVCIFDDVKRMPIQNAGFDYWVDGKRVEVKSSSIEPTPTGTRWHFGINHNTSADEFLIVALDNRTNLRPMHIWLIPGNLINHLKGLSIQNSLYGMNQWKEYEIIGDKFYKVCMECDRLRSIGWIGDWAIVHSDKYGKRSHRVKH